MGLGTKRSAVPILAMLVHFSQNMQTRACENIIFLVHVKIVRKLYIFFLGGGTRVLFIFESQNSETFIEQGMSLTKMVTNVLGTELWFGRYFYYNK